MEPLSITVASIGLLKTANEVSSGIARLVASKKNGSNEIKEIKTTVDTLRSVLLQLQLLLLNHGKIDERRASMILVDEVVVTLTACVMTFSDLDSCIEGLEADEKLGILGSVRWASKSAELRRYKADLEAHKSSLSLMVNILSCQSVHNLANDAAELKVMMVRILDNNKALAERMSILERVQWEHSVEVRRDNEAASTFGRETANGLDVDALESNHPKGPKGHPAFAFEEDLSKSWVYQRPLVRGPRTFSIATSERLTHVTQSWSVFSGISLSQISNIAVQCLPIFQNDLKDNHLYDFGVVSHASRIKPDDSPFLGITSRLPDFEALRASFRNSKFETHSYQNDRETDTLPKINEESPNKYEFVLPELNFSLSAQEMDGIFENMSKVEDEAAVFVTHHSSEIVPEATGPKVLSTRSTSSSPDREHDTAFTSFEILYIAASLFEFRFEFLGPHRKSEGGHPYLTYEAGSIFNVIGERGDLWLAINQNDPSREIGWIWGKHFARLPVDQKVPPTPGQLAGRAARVVAEIVDE